MRVQTQRLHPLLVVMESMFQLGTRRVLLVLQGLSVRRHNINRMDVALDSILLDLKPVAHCVLLGTRAWMCPYHLFFVDQASTVTTEAHHARTVLLALSVQ